MNPEYSTFKNKSVVPPGNKYFYIVPETDTHFETYDFFALCKEVRQHYVSNGIKTPENLETLIQDWMCKNLPTDFCKHPSGSVGKTWLSASRIRSFSQVFFNRMFSHELVPEAQADSRARTCMTCEHNMKNVCTTCNGLEGFAKKLLRVPRKTAFDPALGACQACGCLLRVKVHVPLEDLNIKNMDDYPDHCWLRTEQPEPAADLTTFHKAAAAESLKEGSNET